MFAWLTGAIAQAAYAVGGKEKGARTRDQTQLKTDKLVSNFIMIIPLALLMFTSIFTPNIFKFESLLCQRTQWWNTNRDYPQHLVSETEGQEGTTALTCPGCKPSLKIDFSGHNNRHFTNSWCWNRLEEWDFEDEWVQVGAGKPEMEHRFKDKENYTPTSLQFHKFFPYVLLVLTAIASVPLIFWTHFADDQIQPEVKFFRESLEALAKTLYKDSKSSGSASSYFKAVRNIQNDVETGVVETPKDNSRRELLMSQFATIFKFMEAKTKGQELIKQIVVYRVMNMVALLGTIIVLAKYSLTETRSEFTCKVEYSATNIHYQYCSITGVGMRLDMTKAWILGYAVLFVIAAAGSYLDYRKFKHMPEYESVVLLFRSTYQDGGPALDNTKDDIHDLKLLVLLASENLTNNGYVRSIFQMLNYAEIAINNENKTKDHNGESAGNPTRQETKQTKVMYKFMELMQEEHDNDNADMVNLLKSLD